MSGFRKIRRAYRVQYRPVNWFRVVADLQRCGLCLRQIGQAVDARAQTVCAWVNCGVEPRHRTGEKLLLLYADVVGKDVPRL